MLHQKQHINRAYPNILKRAFIAISALTLMSFSQAAFAQDANEAEADNNTSVSQGLTLNIGSANSADIAASLPTTSNLIDLPSQSVGSTLFKLDISDPDCLTGAGQCLRRDDRVNLGVSKQFKSVSDTGLDLTLTPRASMQFGEENSSALVGAVVEIGEDLRGGSEFKNNTWYVFAGADAEALTYSPNSINRLTSGQFHLQDRIIVGDAQAGVGYRIGDADVSLSYMRREAQSDDFSFTEDAAALSFTWKR